MADTAGNPVEPDLPPRRGRRRWVWPVATALALMVGVGIGAAGSTDPATSPEYAALSEERDGLRNQLATVEARADAAEERIAGEQERAEAAEVTVAEHSDQLDEREAELDARAAEVADQEAAIEEREGAVGAAEDRVAETQIHDGVWTVGVDIEPGTYRVAEAVTDRCYWAILRSGTNGRDIISNDIPTGGFPTVTLSEGQDFETRCGVWNKQ